MWHVFLSHTSPDKDFVRRLAKDLKKEGVRVWLDEWELAVGDSLREKIEEGIRSSAFLAVVLSPSSVVSRWVAVELNAAFARELESQSVFVLPVLHKRCSIPEFLKDKVYADFTTSYEDGLSSLLHTIRQRAAVLGHPSQLQRLETSESLQAVLDECAQKVRSNVFFIRNDRRIAASDSVPLPRYCVELRKLSGAYEASDIDALERARGLRRSFIYECHIGLADFVTPVVMDGVFIGALFTGQTRLRKADDSITKAQRECDRKARYPIGTFSHWYKKIKLTSGRSIEKRMQAMNRAAKQVAGISKKPQKKPNKS